MSAKVKAVPCIFINMMKITRLAALLLMISLAATSCYITRAWHNRNFELKNLKDFDAITLPPSSDPWHFQGGPSGAADLKTWLDSNLAGSDSYSFMVVRNDSVLYEKYFNGVAPDSKLPSFSVAKSWISTLVGMALEEGKIKSLQDPVTDYIPELGKRDERFRNITLQHLLDMRSGVKSSEEYSNPFSDVLKLGFTKNIRPKTLAVKYGKPPGEFEYRSVNTQLLAMVLESATGEPVQDYMKRKLWLPLGMEYEASWNIDSKKHGKVRAFCCLNAATRDFAKLGRLMLRKGEWNGRQLVSSGWVDRSTSLDTLEAFGGYKNQWWSEPTRRSFPDSASALAWSKQLPYRSELLRISGPGDGWHYVVKYREAFHAEGLLGQFIYVNPAKHLVIVRTGHYWKHPKYSDTEFVYLTGSLF